MTARTATKSASIARCGTRASDMNMSPPCPTRRNFRIDENHRLDASVYCRAVEQMRDSRSDDTCL